MENVDKIIAEKGDVMKKKMISENQESLFELKDLQNRIVEEQLHNKRLLEENRSKDAVIDELSMRLKAAAEKFNDRSLYINVNEVAEKSMLTNDQFIKLTERFNKLEQKYSDIRAENKILRKLHDVPDNFGFDLE